MSALCGTDAGLACGGDDAARRASARSCRRPASCWRSRRSTAPGLVVTSEGAFVRVLRVTPPNPLILSAEDRQAVAAGFCRLIGRLRPGAVAAVLRRRAAGPPRRRCWPTRAREVEAVRRARRRPATAARATRRRCRAGGCTRRWRSRCASTPTSRPPSSSARYVVIPYLPRQRAARAALAQPAPRRGSPSAPLERGVTAHRRAVRESQAHVDAAALGARGARAARHASSTASRCSRCCGRA